MNEDDGVSDITTSVFDSPSDYEVLNLIKNMKQIIKRSGSGCVLEKMKHFKYRFKDFLVSSYASIEIKKLLNFETQSPGDTELEFLLEVCGYIHNDGLADRNVEYREILLILGYTTKTLLGTRARDAINCIVYICTLLDDPSLLVDLINEYAYDDACLLELNLLIAMVINNMKVYPQIECEVSDVLDESRRLLLTNLENAVTMNGYFYMSQIIQYLSICKDSMIIDFLVGLQVDLVHPSVLVLVASNLHKIYHPNLHFECMKILRNIYDKFRGNHHFSQSVFRNMELLVNEMGYTDIYIKDIYLDWISGIENADITINERDELISIVCKIFTVFIDCPGSFRLLATVSRSSQSLGYAYIIERLPEIFEHYSQVKGANRIDFNLIDCEGFSEDAFASVIKRIIRNCYQVGLGNVEVVVNNLPTIIKEFWAIDKDFCLEIIQSLIDNCVSWRHRRKIIEQLFKIKHSIASFTVYDDMIGKFRKDKTFIVRMTASYFK